MIETINIYKAVADAIRSHYGDNMEINSRNTQEGFRQNCFYLEMVTSTPEDMSEESVEETLVMRVTYIPASEKDTEEVFNAKEALQEIFHRNLKISDEFYLSITRQDFTLSRNNGLEMMIDFYYVQDEAEAAGVLLDTLSIDLTNNEGGE